jgi:putative tryptophan/tyrosine transport system substrate-binding protein
MRRRVVCFTLSVILVTLSSYGEAQPQKLRQIGFLSGASFVSTQARVEAFRQELRALGYLDGKNVMIDWRFAEETFSGYRVWPPISSFSGRTR